MIEIPKEAILEVQEGRLLNVHRHVKAVTKAFLANQPDIDKLKTMAEIRDQLMAHHIGHTATPVPEVIE